MEDDILAIITEIVMTKDEAKINTDIIRPSENDINCIRLQCIKTHILMYTNKVTGDKHQFDIYLFQCLLPSAHTWV